MRFDTLKPGFHPAPFGMLTPDAVLDKLLFLFPALALLTALRMGQLRLIGQFPAFFAYLLFRAARAAVMSQVNRASNDYFWVYSLTQPVTWIFYLFIVKELYREVLGHYQGILRLARTTMRVVLVAAGGVAVAVTVTAWGGETRASRLIPVLVSVNQTLTLTLAIFLFGLLVFVAYFPNKISQNVLRHSLVLGLYFLHLLPGYFGLGTGPGPNFVWWNLALHSVSWCALIAWMALVRQPAEASADRPIRLFHYGDDARLIRALESLNASLLRSSRVNS